MDRDLWVEDIVDKRIPPWPCPTCRRGNLALLTGTWRDDETVQSKRLRKHADWDPEWIQYAFSAQLQCKNESCGETVELVGRGSIEPDADENGVMSFVDSFRPLLMHPMPEIFRIPEGAHIELKVALRASFQSFWSDPAGAANSMRIALERLLDSLGFSYRDVTKNGRRKPVNLHQRLERMRVKYPDAATQLMALKWLGNTGSHSIRVNRYDVLDGYEVLEECLAELVDARSKRVAELAARLSKRHQGKARR